MKQTVHYKVVVICVDVFICVYIKLYMYTLGYECICVHTLPPQ